MRFLGAFLLLVAACSSAASPDASFPADTSESPIEPAPPVVDPAPPAVTPPAPVPTACDVTVPRTKPIAVAALPDAGATPFTTVLDHAKKTIRVFIYELGTGPILDALEAKAKAGVDVKVILDVKQKSTNEKYRARLAAAGANVIWSDPTFSYMHAKVMIVDESESVISTGNYGQTYMMKERNYAMTNLDPADVAVLVRLFDADFTRTSPDLSCTRLLVSPVNSHERILDLIHSAKTKLDIESMQFADSDVRDAVAERAAAGVAVRVILADPAWIDTNTDAASFLASHSIPVRTLASPAVHVKSIIADDRAYAGSENLSWTSLEKNREVGVIFDEPTNLALLHTTFDKDWSAAAP